MWRPILVPTVVGFTSYRGVMSFVYAIDKRQTRSIPAWSCSLERCNNIETAIKRPQTEGQISQYGTVAGGTATGSYGALYIAHGPPDTRMAANQRVET